MQPLTVAQAVTALRAGRTVIVPTETVYGLAGLATDQAAIAEIYRIKERPHSNPLILHFHSLEQMLAYTEEPDLARLASHFWPGPLTLLLKHGGRVPLYVTAGSDRAAYRIPDHPLLLDILRQCDVPLAAPSANKSGQVSPTDFAEVDAELARQTAGVVDGGPCRLGLESTILLPVGPAFRIVRPGLLTAADLERAGLKIISHAATGAEEQATAPGQGRHYAPLHPLYLLATEPGPASDHTLAPAPFSEDVTPGTNPSPAKEQLILPAPACTYLDSGHGRWGHLPWKNRILLPGSPDLTQVARSLFHTWKTAPDGPLVMELVPETGPGVAINDRVRRAASAKIAVIAGGPDLRLIRVFAKKDDIDSDI